MHLCLVSDFELKCIINLILLQRSFAFWCIFLSFVKFSHLSKKFCSILELYFTNQPNHVRYNRKIIFQITVLIVLAHWIDLLTTKQYKRLFRCDFILKFVKTLFCGYRYSLGRISYFFLYCSYIKEGNFITLSYIWLFMVYYFFFFLQWVIWNTKLHITFWSYIFH